MALKCPYVNGVFDVEKTIQVVNTYTESPRMRLTR